MVHARNVARTRVTASHLIDKPLHSAIYGCIILRTAFSGFANCGMLRLGSTAWDALGMTLAFPADKTLATTPRYDRIFLDQFIF